MTYATLKALTNTETAERLNDDRYYPDDSFYAQADTLAEVVAALREGAAQQEDPAWGERMTEDADLVDAF